MYESVLYKNGMCAKPGGVPGGVRVNPPYQFDFEFMYSIIMPSGHVFRSADDKV